MDEKPKAVSLLKYSVMCIKKALETTWDTADSGASVFGAIIGILIHYMPRLEPAMNSILWEIPVACFASVGVTRLFLSPFLIYRERDLEAKRFEDALKNRHSEEEIQSTLGAALIEAAELRYEEIISEPQLDEWINRFNNWKEQTVCALGDFGLAADYALFQNADASQRKFVNPTGIWQTEVNRLDAVLLRHIQALEKILESRPKVSL